MFGGFGMWGEDSIMCKDENEEDKREQLRRFLYQQAINGYQFHVNRYHTWMNYYSIFTGALFVGFCSLTTATTKIEESCNSIINQCCSIKTGCKVYTLTNDYSLLILTLCILGLISSICWLLSLCGHEKWEDNWIKNIEYYEDKKDDEGAENDRSYNSLELYKVINGDKSKFKAFSTHTITKIFISYVIVGWVFCFALTICGKNYCYSTMCCLISSTLIFIIPMIVIFYFCKSSLYSALHSKISRSENTNHSKN